MAFFSKCQSLSVGEQLRAGYRYLDIRLALDGDSLKLVHGFTNCKVGRKLWDKPLMLDAVLGECYEFLAAHPTETVLFGVKKETKEDDTAAFQRALASYIEKNPSRWLLTDHLPTVGETRGKLVLLRRYADQAGLEDKAGLSFCWEEQKGTDDRTLNTVMEDNGSFRLWVQDRFEYSDSEKWEAFLAGLHEQEISAKDVALHFLSTKGTAKYGHPFTHARALNPKFLRLQANELSGWIIVDFADAAMAEKIYGANFD
jgi:1-phosphatidylinositol phosphodiesterase